MSKEQAEHRPGALKQAGIEQSRFSGTSVELEEIRSACILRLHSLEPARELASALAGQDIGIPLQSNQATGHDPAALCLRPNEWLLFSMQHKAASLAEQLKPAIDPALTALLDNSDGLATFRLSGTGAPWLLGKLSGLDFLAGSDGNQHCARTRMGHAAVVVHYHQPGDDSCPFVFDLVFDRSIANYMWNLLTESAPHADELAEAFGNDHL
jgi:heterotetrameric sarcosine oxidase gamma subunit